MLKIAIRFLALVLTMVLGELHATNGVVVIGNANVQSLDVETLEKIYTGRQIQLGTVYVTPVNADTGNSVRDRFLQAFLRQDEGKYTGYWRVRRSTGQGKPPREINKATDIIEFVRSTPGAIGYIGEDDLRPGVNVLLK